MYARLRLVTKKMSATIVVNLLRKVAFPLAPKTVEEAPEPKAAPASAPFPCCTRTRTTRITARIICIVNSAVCIVYLSQIVEQISINFFAINDAPPIRSPSMCSVSIKDDALSGVTLPP